MSGESEIGQGSPFSRFGKHPVSGGFLGTTNKEFRAFYIGSILIAFFNLLCWQQITLYVFSSAFILGDFRSI